MAPDCSLNYEFSTRKIQVQNMLCTKIVLNAKTKKQFLYTTCSEFVFFLYWSRKSMNSLSSYCGLTDSRMSASDIDLPVISAIFVKSIYFSKKIFALITDQPFLIPVHRSSGHKRVGFGPHSPLGIFFKLGRKSIGKSGFFEHLYK